jgi:hypothetical protein
MTRSKTWRVGKVSRFRLGGHTGTAFHRSTAALATTNWYFNWDLRMVPDEYVDYSEELKAIRTNVAMGDMSPRGGTRVAFDQHAAVGPRRPAAGVRATWPERSGPGSGKGGCSDR